MRVIRVLRGWIVRHRAALLIAIVPLLLGLVQFLPPRVEYFRLARTLDGAFIQLYGVSLFFVGVFVRHDLPPAPTGVVLFAVGLAMGLVIEWFWVRGWRSRLALVLLLVSFYAANWLFGSMLLAFANYDTVGPGGIICDLTVSETNRIQLISFKEDYQTDASVGSNIFVMSSRDAGHTWTQIMYSDSGVDNFSCPQVHSLSAQQYWLWFAWNAAVTTDGGRTWQTWEPKKTWPGWSCCPRGNGECCNGTAVKNVEFQDSLHGHMTLGGVFPGQQTWELMTADGGKTWQ